MMLNMDPPRHDRFKLLVSKGFTPKSAAALAPRVEALAKDIVDDVIERGECDLVTDLCGRLPSALIAELLGIPRADGERLYDLTEIMHDAVTSVEAKMAAIGEMLGYAASVAQAKRANPGDDIASILVEAEVDGERLTDDEFQWFTLLLVNAGGDTTRNLLAAGVELLFQHPDQHARLMADLETLLPSTVEEMLRFVSPVVNFRRTTTADTTIRGVDIPAGDKVVIFYGAANRDADVFANPDVFDIGRSPNPHQAFGGGGPHLCLGLHLARLESVALLRQMLTRLPDMHRAGPTERLESSFIAGIRHLPVAFTPGTR
jgi:cytochrome P450